MKADRFISKLNFFGLILSIALAFTAGAAGQAPKNAKKDAKKAEQLSRQAAAAFVKKDYRVALDGYTQAATLNPTNADYRFWKGASHFYLSEYALAIPDLDSALSLGYTKPLDLYSIRWVSNFKEKNYDAALADVRQGLVLDPNNLDMLQALGDISYQKNNYREAVDAYQKVALKNPNTAGDLYFYIAKSQASLGDVAGQISAAQEAIKRRTQFLADANLLIADGYQKQKNHDGAIDAYLKTIAAKPDLYSAYENLANLYLGQNRFTEAIDISRKALRVFPNDGHIYANLSWFYSLADRNEEAIQAAQAGIRFLPNNYLAYTNLCRAYNDAKKPEMAIRECNNALTRQPNDGETFFYLARAYDLAGKPNEATKYYKLAVTGMQAKTKSDPDSPDGFYILGNAYSADNQLDKAVAAYMKCLELSPKFVRARYNLAIIQLRQKNKTAALEQYNRLRELDPELAGKLKVEIDRS
ncbi:MAG TPA: tetratricopeptide repeat protein [Pyrinomonadaceae bacterium]|nr:tetratricopeptide repeat protein [Pyrinomonadaceae bacterium]